MNARGRGVIGSLRGLAIRVQLPLVIASVPVLLVLHSAWIAPVVVGVVAGDGALPAERDAALAAARASLAIAAVVAMVAATAAALLLRGTIRAAVEHLCDATESIARGDFAHRIASPRRDELGVLARSIDSMAGRLERLEQARRRVLACVSHELRTPLTIVQGHAFSLQRGESDPLRRERLELVQREAMRLAALVDELVDASSIHAGGVRIRARRCDLVELVRAQVVRHSDAAAVRDVGIELSGRRHRVDASVDRARFEQVVDNLLANAVRHARPGSTIEVRVDSTRGGMREVEVANDCEPMEAEFAERVFEPFVRGSVRAGSVGLGLAIAHGIAHAHGGTLRLDVIAATRGRACFVVQLPAPARRGSRELRGAELSGARAAFAGADG